MIVSSHPVQELSPCCNSSKLFEASWLPTPRSLNHSRFCPRPSRTTQPLVISERYNFHIRKQSPTESTSEYVAELRRLASTCDFGAFLDEALRDRLVCGMRNEGARRKLLTESKLTLTKAIELAQCMEMADKNSKIFHGADGAVHKISQQRRAPPRSQERKPCRHCGRKNHQPSQCRFADATCHHCNKKGHIAPICRSKKDSQKPSKPATNTKYVTEREGRSEDEFYLHMVTAKSATPITSTLDVEGRPLKREVDTGAAFSIISEKTRKSQFSDVKLRPLSIRLKTYTDEKIHVLGQLHVHVKYGEQRAPLVLLVVDGEGPSLMGRNWLRYIRLDWKSIHAVIDAGVATPDQLTEKYADIFTDELGKVSDLKVTLHVKSDARPIFKKPRPVPFAIKEKIERELDELESNGVITKITHSEWAAPIVPVPKKNGRFRICGDYKVTLNQALDVDQYPLPKPDDLFATLAGGKQFSTLDLSQAYTQVPLDDESAKLVAIHTHRGLYKYNRLPFGVASAPAMFQKLTDTVLRDIPHVICYLDDILVTGTNEEEHLRNLESVFERLRQFGFRLRKEKCAFLRNSVVYLGHNIDANGLHTVHDKVEAVTNAKAPQNVQQLRAFLGMLNYYGKFMPNLSTVSARLSPTYYLTDQRDLSRANWSRGTNYGNPGWSGTNHGCHKWSHRTSHGCHNWSAPAVVGPMAGGPTVAAITGPGDHLWQPWLVPDHPGLP